MSVIYIKSSQRNPLQNWQVNPARNWRINPAQNWQINPAQNWQINPARNWQINPARNWQVNPARNWQINPARNWQINPARNWQVNPARNRQINPHNTFSLPGQYVIRVSDSVVEFFTVKTENNDVLLIFNADANFVFFAISSQTALGHCMSVFSVADYSNVGFMCPNSAGGFNWFDLSGKWLYYTT